MIDQGKNKTLVAYLGTCVGVTLYDRQADVGGLAHFLLPEPIGTEKPYEPFHYASTGLPLFIQSLIDTGASKDRLEACIAGGALVGPVTELDLALDLGGRTVEIVERILTFEGIPIRQAETCGYFTCSLSLDLSTWETLVEPIESPIGADHSSSFERPTAKQLENVIENVRPIPQIALKVIRMIHDAMVSMEDIAEEIRQDQVISAKMIRFSNSAYFGPKRVIDSIDRALTVLGEKNIIKFIISSSFEDFYRDRKNGYSLCKGGLYRHTLGTASMAEVLANFTGKASPDIAYTAGLLHDIGKVVLDQFMDDAHSFFYRRFQADTKDLIEVEQDVFNISHTEAGGLLAENWSLPDTLIDIIRNHHGPEQAAIAPDLAHIVYLADLIMSRFFVGQELERMGTRTLSSRLNSAGLRLEHLPVLIGSIPKDVFSLFEEN